MHPALDGLRRKVRRQERGRLRRDPLEFTGNPVAYSEYFLQLDPGLWETQKEIANAIHEYPYKVMVPAAHSVGKTFLAAVLTNYWFDCFPESSAVITTAPTARDVRDLLWREVRLLRRAVGLGGFTGSRAPELWESDDHYAKGWTADKGELFVGRHLKHMLFIFDEACLIDSAYWTTTASMFQPDGRHAWLAIGNPTDTSSQMYAECIGDGWNVKEMSALDHPNLAAELRGDPLPYPTAVTLSQFESWISQWTTPVGEKDATPLDLAWPPPKPCPQCREGIRKMEF